MESAKLWKILLWYTFRLVVLLGEVSQVLGFCRNLEFRTRIKDKVLTNHTIRTIHPIIDARRCRSQCFLESLCFGVNVCVDQDSTATCELTNSDHIRSEGDLVDKPGCTFYGSETGCSSSPCASNATCQGDFVQGTQPHRCICPTGYTGQMCEIDIDECALGDHVCHVNATCNNTNGGYNCTCKNGYQGNGFSCEDINECTSGMHGCSENASCTNFPGGHNCTCKNGFLDDGKVCVDIDECSSDTHDCHVNATCSNTIGGHSCSCFQGFIGNGSFCRYPKDCDEVKTHIDRNATTGFYLIQENPDLVYRFCEIGNKTGCGEGIWTLVMKIDGTKPTFKFDSQLWRNSVSYNEEVWYSGLQKTETKQPAFWSKPIKTLCLGMKYDGVTNWISTSLQASSLLSAISGKANLTFGRSKWISLLDPVLMETHCNREGFDEEACEDDVRSVISFWSNSHDHCSDCDAFIGFGATDPICGDRNFDVNQQRAAFCYILVQ